MLPLGEFHAEAGEFSGTADTEVAVGLGGVLEYQLHPNFAIGFTPRVLLNIKTEGGTASAKELDLLVLLIGGGPVATNVELYGFAAPGCSILYIPDSPDGVDDPAGFLFHFGGGVGFDLGPGFRLATEIGYQFGGHDVTVQGQTVEANTTFLHLGVAALAIF